MERRRFAGWSIVVGLLLGSVIAALGEQTRLRPRLAAGSRASPLRTQLPTREIVHFEGRGTEQPLLPGATHAYLFDLQLADFIDIQLEQNGLDLIASVFAPGRRLLFRVDGMNGAFGPERVPLLASGAGRYAVEVTGRGRGTYHIRVPPRRKATAEDHQNYLGAVAYSRGKELALGKRESRLRVEEQFEEALREWTKCGHLPGQADASFKLTQLRIGRKAWSESIVYARRALDLYRDLGNRRQEAIVLNDLGLAYDNLGEFGIADSFYGRALDLIRQEKDLEVEADVLLNRGLMDSEGGEYERALVGLERALAIREARKDEPLAMAKVLNALGRLHSNLEETDTALRLHGQVLEILRRNPNDEIMAATLTHLGDAHRRRGDFRRAVSLYLQALTVTQRSGLPEDPKALNNLSLAYYNLQRYTEALSALQHCARAFESQGNPALAAVAWANMGWVLTSMGRYQGAFEAYDRSLAMVRGRDRPPTELAAYFGMARAARQRGNLIAARSFLGKALVLVEALRTKASRARLRTSYLAGRQNLYDLLVEILMEEHRRQPAKGYDVQAFEASEKARSRSLLDVLEGQPVIPAVSVQDIQKQVLGEDVVLLEYFLGEDRSFVWIVTSSSFGSRELPPRRRIATLARKVHALLGASNRIEDRGEAIRKATELSRILFGTIAKDLTGKRILIVAPPALQYISFGALPADVTLSRRAGGVWPAPWVKDHEIVVGPSAAVLAALRRKRSGRRAPSGLIAVLADPVYSRADERAKGLEAPSSSGPRPPFSRLLFSQREVEAIEEQVSGAERLIARGFDANRRMVLAGRLSGYRYLHFSTHGALAEDLPERSAIALSFLEPDGKDIDGYLRAGEIAALQLPADLAVLSACKTGLGREIRGEGLVGLVQAFFSAGASRVMVSLWDVDAQATADLMGRFYRNLFRKNLSPAAALREAQEWMWKQPKWNAPAYWAGFVLQGEWQ